MCSGRFWHLPLLRLELQVVIRLRFSGLSHGEGPSPLWDHGEGHAGKDEARKNGDRKYVLLDLVMSGGICESEDDVLHLVIHSAACLERAGLGIQRQVVEVRLEQPEGLEHQGTCVSQIHPTTTCNGSYQQSCSGGLFAKIQEKLLQCH